jgi:hypothetical protein
LFGVSLAAQESASTEPIHGIYASANYFRVLGVEIAIERDFEPPHESPNRNGLAVDRQ